MKTLLIALALSIVPAAHAAQERGNGGDAIVCDNGTRAQFYDVYEAKERFEFPPQIPAGADWREITAKLIDRFQPLNPSRADRFRKRLARFLDESKFLSGVRLIDVPDTGVGFVPAGCEMRQLVVQRPPRFATDKRYTVDQDLWNLLDEQNKAALVLHELILGDAIEDNHETSESTRYLNALALGDQLRSFPDWQYLRVLENLQFIRGADAYGVSITLRSMRWDGNRLRAAEAAEDFRVDNFGLKGTATCRPGEGVEFTGDGLLARVNFDGCSGKDLTISGPGFRAKVVNQFYYPDLNGRPARGFWLAPGALQVDQPKLKLDTVLEAIPQGFLGTITVANHDEFAAILLYGRVPQPGPCDRGELELWGSWRKLSFLDYGPNVRNVGLCETRSLGGISMPLQVYVPANGTDQRDDLYGLSAPLSLRFRNAEVQADGVSTPANDPSKLTAVRLAKEAKIKQNGQTLLCHARSELRVENDNLLCKDSQRCTCAPAR